MLQKEGVNNGAKPQKRWERMKRAFSQTGLIEVKVGKGIVWRRFEQAHFILSRPKGHLLTVKAQGGIEELKENGNGLCQKQETEL